MYYLVIIKEAGGVINGLPDSTRRAEILSSEYVTNLIYAPSKIGKSGVRTTG